MIADTYPAQSSDLAYMRYVNGRLSGLRTDRYSWWTHWRELADYFLPRRYKWLVTPNQQSRGSPINGHIIDSTGVVAARNLAAGLMSGKTSPTRPWFKLKINGIDSTGTTPISIWLKECETILHRVFQKSNFYNSIAQFYYDLVIFGTATLIIYEDYQSVINCFNPCAGEYYVAIDGRYRPTIFYREFTMTIGALIDRFGYENCSQDVQQAYDLSDGSGLSREVIVGHAIEPNDDDKAFLPRKFKFREVYWQLGGSQGPQSGGVPNGRFLSKKGYYSQCAITVRWDLVSNDAYGRSVSMDGLGDQKQLQLESKRKAQAIDKMVNPPLVADIQLKNQPASLLPGGMTYASFAGSGGKPSIASIYDTKFPIGEIKEDLDEVRERLKKIFFNDLFQPMSQYETRSNISIPEIDQRKAEALIMLGPVFTRIDDEGLDVIVERVWDIVERAGLIPPPPPEISEAPIDIEFVSMLASAQKAAEATGIDRLLGLVGNMAAVKPDIILKLDENFTIDKYNELLQNDPRILRSNEEVDAMKAQQAQQAQAMQQAEQADLLAKGAKTLSETDLGGGRNALQMMTGI